jgi:hypothetical protein
VYIKHRGFLDYLRKYKTSQEELRSMELASCIAFSLEWRAGRISILYTAELVAVWLLTVLQYNVHIIYT